MSTTKPLNSYQLQRDQMSINEKLEKTKVKASLINNALHDRERRASGIGNDKDKSKTRRMTWQRIPLCLVETGRPRW